MERLTSGTQIFGDGEKQRIYNKLKEYEDLEEKGLLKIFPCKVGGMTYHPDKLANRVENNLVERIEIDSSGVFIFNRHGGIYYASDFGKIVFTTQAEAEEVLLKK